MGIPSAQRVFPGLFVLYVTASIPAVYAASSEFRGMVHIGAATDHSRSDELTSRLNKLPLGAEQPSARVAMRFDAVISDFAIHANADIDSHRTSLADLHETWLGWHPIPSGPWRVRARAGAFFPVSSFEVGYDQIGWGAERTVSGSAINSWIAEEIRILGAELTTQWRGALVGSPHEFTTRLGLFGGNDPAGTQIGWRGWHVGNRTTGLFQNLRIPDLPVYSADGPFAKQTHTIQLFREIDGRPDYYTSAGYAYDGRVELEILHYDNRADPLIIKDGQYSWQTRFDHAAVRLHLDQAWMLQAQVIRGKTVMGGHAIDAEFSTWYVLTSRQFNAGTATLRHDRFKVIDHDGLFNDSNAEDGYAWALPWAQPLSVSLLVLVEAQQVTSERPARTWLQDSARQVEKSLIFEVRWAL